jgi:hypothetical protein
MKWSELAKTKETEIMAAIKEAKQNAYGFGGQTSGYHYDVEMDKDGDVYVTGVHSQNWQTQNSYFGKTLCIMMVHAWEVDLQYDDPADEKAECNAKCDEIDNFMNDIDFDDIIRDIELNETI